VDMTLARQFNWRHVNPPSIEAVPGLQEPALVEPSPSVRELVSPHPSVSSAQPDQETRNHINRQERHHEEAGPQAYSPPARQRSETEERVERMLAASRNDDWDSFDKDLHAFASMPPAQELQARSVMQADHLEQLAAQDRLLAQQQQQIQELQQQQVQQQSRSHGLSR
jgi:hypothetical protein